MSFKYKEIAEILKIIDASDCEEMILETDGIRLVVKRQGAARIEELSGKNEFTTQQPQGARQQSAPAFSSAPSLSEPEPKLKERTDGCIEILAPMVGTNLLMQQLRMDGLVVNPVKKENMLPLNVVQLAAQLAALVKLLNK